jgi:hypothetical protein
MPCHPTGIILSDLCHIHRSVWKGSPSTSLVSIATNKVPPLFHFPHAPLTRPSTAGHGRTPSQQCEPSRVDSCSSQFSTALQTFAAPFSRCCRVARTWALRWRLIPACLSFRSLAAQLSAGSSLVPALLPTACAQSDTDALQVCWSHRGQASRQDHS